MARIARNVAVLTALLGLIILAEFIRKTAISDAPATSWWAVMLIIVRNAAVVGACVVLWRWLGVRELAEAPAVAPAAADASEPPKRTRRAPRPRRVAAPASDALTPQSA